MKLTELDPRWTAVESDRHGQGIVFLCPKCKDHYLGVYFSNPIDGKLPYLREGQNSGHLWSRTGDTFETLSITPSIRVVDGCAWHGYVTAGDIITC
jgi:hypothetical protein